MFDRKNNDFDDLFKNTKKDEDRYYKEYDNYLNIFNAYFFKNIFR